jgi:hypothetical protein
MKKKECPNFFIHLYKTVLLQLELYLRPFISMIKTLNLKWRFLQIIASIWKKILLFYQWLLIQIITELEPC